MRFARLFAACVALLFVPLLLYAWSDRIGDTISGGNVGGGGTSESPSGIHITGSIPLTAAGVSESGSYYVTGGDAIGPTKFPVEALSATYDADSIMTVTAVNRTLTVSLAGGTGTASGKFYYRYGGEVSYLSANMTVAADNSLTYSLSNSLLTIRGLEYYFTVTKGDTTVEIGTDGSPYVFVTQLTNSQAQKPSNTPAGSYRIVGLPLSVQGTNSVSAVFSDDLGDYDKTQWRLGRWSSAIDGFLEYPNPPRVVPGRGYWLITKTGKTFGAAGYSVRPDKTVSIQGADVRFYEIELDSGWNQIANPFPFEVAWDEAMIDDNGTVVDHSLDLIQGDKLYFYAGSGYDSTDVNAIPTWEGIFLFARKSGLKALVRFHENGALPSPMPMDHWVAKRPASLWQIELTLQVGDQYDLKNVAGVIAGAESGLDKYDLFEPPTAPDGVMLAFQSMDGDPALYQADFRPEMEDGQMWNVILSGGHGRTLTVKGVSSIPSNREAELILDNGSEIVLDLDQSCPLPDEVSSMKLLVGTKQYVGDQSAILMPVLYDLEQNYPNPFNPTTQIGFSLPKTSYVRLEVFNLLGQKVTTLIDRRMYAGNHSAIWDGTDHDGAEVGGGIYFYRISADDFVKSRKMVLLK